MPMHLSKVKLVVTDMDGTLLNSKGIVSDQFIDLYHELSRKGVHFVAASGRQYYSIVSKLEAISDQITIIAENGGFVVKDKKELMVKEIKPSVVRSFMEELRAVSNSYIILCGKKRAYAENSDEKFIDIFSEYYHKYEIVKDLKEVKDDAILKIATYHLQDSEKYIYPKVKVFEKDYQVKVSGKNWLDISNADSNKGVALEYVQQKMGIQKSETMVFGDYNNDLEMLELADFSYAMENAHPNVIAKANYRTSGNDDLGVEKVLKELLEAKNSL